MVSLRNFGVLLLLAWRNLFSHKVKNIIVGLLIAFGTFLLVLGSALISSVEKSMSKSITGSVAGHLQVHDEDARDDLALFGGEFIGTPDIGSITDFKKVKEVISKVPNVKAVVPMGIDTAEFYSASELDRAIEDLRTALQNSDQKRIGIITPKIRTMAERLEEEYRNRQKVMANLGELKEAFEHIQVAKSDEFWNGIAERPDEAIEFLDTKLAPLVDENEGMFLRYLGTDLHLFAKEFDRFEIVEGEMPPFGARGLILSQNFYDNSIRNRVARFFDYIKEDRDLMYKKIATDPVLKNRVERMARQYRLITFQLEPEQAEALSGKLKKTFGIEKGTIEEMVQTYLTVDDENFDERYQFFFDEIAPMIKLYLFDVGDVITIRGFTKSGYIKSVNVKIWGTFKFNGLEESDLAGGHNLLDMLTFRDLYGMMTTEKKKELAGIQKEVAVADVSAEDAEAALFGGGGEIETLKEGDHGFDEFEGIDLRKEVISGQILDQQRHDQEAIDNGIAINAAIVLNDPSLIDETLTNVKNASEDAGLGLNVVDWQTASGMVGQFTRLVKVVLYVAIFIIFLVALVIINNTMIMATMERTVEIGTMRAIGGQRGLVLSLFLVETGFLGMIAGTIGAALGALLVILLGSTGLPAPSDIFVFLFSGNHLYPEVGLIHLVVAFLVIIVVILLATFYPAWMATRIQPVIAMEARE